MDISDLLTQLLQGNNPLIIIAVLAFFFFKKDLFPAKPADPAVPAPPATPPVVVAPAPVDRPVLDLITTQILPVLLPIVVKLIQDQVSKEKESKA